MKRLYIIIAILIISTTLQGCQDKTTTAEITEYQNQVQSLTKQIIIIQNENKKINTQNQKLAAENQKLVEENKADLTKIGTPDEERVAYQRQIEDLRKELEQTKNFYKDNLQKFYKYIENDPELKTQYTRIFDQ